MIPHVATAENPMHRLSLADELAEIRIEIARLKAREAALRQDILKRPGADLIGRWNRVEIEERYCSVFDASLLPDPIRADPQFHRERHLQIVRSLPLHLRPASRPGWPIQREAAALH
jgi:hypothetical protein